MAHPPNDRVAALRLALGARAAGLWLLRGADLEGAGFVPAPDLDPAVADAFARATRSVPLTRTDLGIVQAAVTGSVAVSIASLLPPDVGSGRWLRAFGAARSVAVPLRDDQGRVAAVLSVALPDGPLTDDEVADRVRSSN